MKLLLPLFMLLLGSCKYQTNDKAPDYCSLASESHFWIASEDANGSFLTKGRKSGTISNQDIVTEINKKYTPLSLVIEKRTNDTLFVRIDSAIVLTQRMGTTGALSYKAVVVYSLTENDSINCVFLNFEEGDHGGMPGFFTRKDFDKDFSIKTCSW